MNNKFTKEIRLWLETDKLQRDNALGVEYLLKLSGSRIMHRNLIANPDGKADFIAYYLQKYYNWVKYLTHSKVEEMQEQVDKIVEKQISLKEQNPASEFQKGKRQDHGDLLDEIQALYVENLSIVQQMRELHLKLRTLSTAESPCPDSERYPFLK